MTSTTGLKFNRIRAGWYETGNGVLGAFVISSDAPGSWLISEWADTGYGLELHNIDSCGSFADAKELAEWHAADR